MAIGNRKLAATLVDLRAKIAKFRGRRRRIGEQNTKAVLIDPLLSALGWDLLDLTEVHREYRHKPQDNPVDYALFILRSPCLFVEAKDLDSDLADYKWVSQTLSYATVAGVEWCVLTNGDEYRLYNAHAPVEVEQKLFRVIRVSEADRDEYNISTLDLLSRERMGEKRIDALWRAHFVDRQVKLALDEILSGENASIVRLIRRVAEELTPADIRGSLTRAEIRIEFPVVPPPLPPGKRISLSDLLEADLLRVGVRLESTLKGRTHRGTIVPGGIQLDDGSLHRTPSGAGKAATGMRAVAGWNFWHYYDEGKGEWRQLAELRAKFRERLSGSSSAEHGG